MGPMDSLLSLEQAKGIDTLSRNACTSDGKGPQLQALAKGIKPSVLPKHDAALPKLAPGADWLASKRVDQKQWIVQRTSMPRVSRFMNVTLTRMKSGKWAASDLFATQSWSKLLMGVMVL